MPVFKSQLTNTNHNVQDKARYFADCFDFYLQHLGAHEFPSLETQRSLLEKIRFQLLNYGRFSKNYIKYHAENKMLDTKDMLMKKFYRSLFPIVLDLRKHKYSDAALRAQMIVSIDKEINCLKNTLARNALNEVITVFECPAPLLDHEHLKVIDYCTGIIVAEFMLGGFPEKDLEKLMAKILTKEVKMKGKETITDFPLPAHFENQFEPEGDGLLYFERIKSFMEKRTLKEQFEGIHNWLIAKPIPCFVIVAISNVTHSKSISKTYGNVTMTNNIKSVLAGYKNKSSFSFVRRKDQLYFKVSFDALSFEEAEIRAFELIDKELPKFEDYFHNRLYVDRSTVMTKLGQEYQNKTSYSAQRIATPSGLKTREENSLEKYSTEAARIFRHQELLFSKAKMTTSKELKVTYYWTYLESFFSLEDPNADKVQNYVSEILGNSEVFFVAFEMFSIAHQLLAEVRHVGIHNEAQDIGFMEIINMLNIDRVKADWLKNSLVVLNHPFLNNRLQPLLNRKIKKQITDLVKYYAGILQETYEQRNLIQHAGIFQPMALDKILRTLPDLAKSFRASILNEIKKNRHQSMEDVLEQLRKPNTKLTRLINKNARVGDLIK